MMKSRNRVRAASVSASLTSGKYLKLCSLSLAISAISSGVLAQEAEVVEEEVLVSGIRASLANALEEKRSSDNLIEVIQSEDIGKLPDQNLAEVLENITGIQITRTAGIGTGVQIRGTNSNRVEINGVSTVSSGSSADGSAGSDRNGIDFEDVNAAIISAVEVTKSPEAKTIEGSVGGTVNLKTIRPLELKEVLGSVRIQGEDSSLSTEGIQPRFSGAFGNNWESGIGDVGFVISASYTEQEAVSFRPRADRDNVVQRSAVEANGVDVTGAPEQWQGIQFLVQEQENDDYETINVASTIEWAPDANTTFHLDYILNDQERTQEQYRIQASGISNLRNYSVPSAFETINYGTIEGQDLPTYEAALVGVLDPIIPTDGLENAGGNSSDGNLRMTSDTNGRLTKSEVFSLGGKWENDVFSASFGASRSESDTSNPGLNTTLNFLNPNAPLINEVRFQDVCESDPNDLENCLTDDDDNPILLYDAPSRYYYSLTDDQRGVFNASNGQWAGGVMGDISTAQDVEDFYLSQAIAAEEARIGMALPVNANGDTAIVSSSLFNDNATPIRYDLRGGALAFGVNEDSPFAPTSADLLNPANYVLDQVEVRQNSTVSKEDALRFDFSVNTDGIVTSVDFGYRYNRSSSTFTSIQDNFGGFSQLQDSPIGTSFAQFLEAGPDNYGDADGRDLFIQDFLRFDPEASFSQREEVIDTLQEAIIAHDSSPDILNLSENLDAFFDVEEFTDALYFQANFESGMFRGNAGLRYVTTNVHSTAYEPDVGQDERELVTEEGSYDALLPRFNLVIQPAEDVIFRLGYGSDILRPDFRALSTAFQLNNSENAVVALGNSGLQPEEVDSWDITGEWYFAPSAVVSLGYFQKERTNLFGVDFQAAALLDDPTGGGTIRETDPTCPGGGIFNPIVVPNVLGDSNQLGLCVDFTIPSNDPGKTTQKGLEFTFQYDLGEFEDVLGFASGFGILANYTIQEFSGGETVDSTSGRGLAVLGDVSINRGLLDFSENAYNVTAYYEKYGLSARMRYTWREAFRTNDFGGSANTSGSSTLSFPVVTEDRGQLNASINYDVTDNFSVGVEAVNLTEERITQRCVSEDGPVCFTGYPDRRITFGGTYTF